MKLSEIGEEALIEHVVRKNLLPASAPGLVVGVGDDAAVLAAGPEGLLTIITADMLSERVDFLPDKITPYQLGWKSVAANISDVAAMGGTPTWTFVTLGLRPDTDLEFVDELYRGMSECASRFGSIIAGGDMNSVPGDYVISITQLGQVEPEYLIRRSTARVADHILVTGRLGDSRGGLELLLRHTFEEATRLSPWLVDAHLTPVPRVPEARAAVRTNAVHAMMDLSDGLGADLPKLCRASGMGALVYADELPVSDELRRAAEKIGIDPLWLAAAGGEDFELLMAVNPEDVDTVREAVESRTGTPVTDIGEITAGDTAEIIYPDGRHRPLTGGWEHFA